MKILHVVTSLASRWGGPAFSITALSQGLQAQGADVTIYATDLATPTSSAEARGGVTPAELPPAAAGLNYELFPVSRPYRWAYSPALRRRLAQTIRSFDLVHIHCLFDFPGMAAFKEASRAGVPYVVSPRGALDPAMRHRGKLRKAVVERMWQRRMLDNAACICYTAEDERRLVADLGYRAPTAVVPNVVNTAPFREPIAASTFRDAHLEGWAGPLIVCHGRLAEKKRLDVLVDALPQIVTQHGDVRLALVGPDDEGVGARLVAQAEALGIKGALAFPGMLHGHDLAAALWSADVWALPSSTENFGVAVVEAMACQRPTVISTRINIAPDIAAADAGIVSEPTPSEFAQVISRLLDDPALRSELGSRGLSFTHRYDASTVAGEMLAVYQAATTRQAIAA